MFGNRGERHLERGGDIGDGHVVFQEHRQNGPAGRVGEGGECGVECRLHGMIIRVAGRIVNRMVEYGEAVWWGRRSGAFLGKSVGYVAFQRIDSGWEAA